MANSWGWRMVEFSASHHEYVARMFGSPNKYLHYSGECRKKGCLKIAECFVVYDYVTGRQGRVSSAEKPYCRDHAQQVMARKQQPTPQTEQAVATQAVHAEVVAKNL